MQIMCNSRIDKREAERLFGIAFDDYFSPAIAALQTLAEDGLCRLEKDAITATEKGQFFLRNIASKFDAYLPTTEQTQRYSRTV
jgi:oxygen-independent coproporphyrinogen-3 oxidase